MVSGDCNDVDASIFPTAVERCDGIDNDCDSAIDEEDDNVIIDAIWYADADQDGFGSMEPKPS